MGHGKKSAASNDPGDKEPHGILEGISSLHSWIKTQTMIRPHSKVRSKQGGTYDEVHNIIKIIVACKHKKNQLSSGTLRSMNIGQFILTICIVSF